MNDELAKELKDAGFAFHKTAAGPVVFIGEEAFATPTLEELILACGNKLLVLQHTPSNYYGDPESAPMDWFALGGEDPRNYFSFQQCGHTPTEAVARLWLALNKKV